MAFTAAVEWDVWTTGSDTLNGGGFAVGSGGTDRSQQAAAFTTYTDLVIDGTTNTDMTSAAHPFTAADVGNIVVITGGTGFTTQRVQITSIPSGVIARCDKSLGTLSSTGGTGGLGGALATPGKGSGLMVGGNTLHIKAGTYSITSASTNVAGGCLSLPAGAATTPIRVIGYQTTHRDGGTRPLLQASGISTFTVCGGSATATSYENISVDCASLTASAGFANTRCFRCKAANCTNGGFNAGTFAYYCEATGCSAVAAFIGNSSFCVAYANTFTGFALTASVNVINCLSVNNSGGSSNGFTLSVGVVCANCTAYGNGNAGFSVTTGNAAQGLFNCLSSGNTGYQFTSSTTDQNVFLLNCAAKADGLGTIGPNLGGLNSGFVTLTADPFVNAAGGNFALNSAPGGGGLLLSTGLPGTFPGSPTINTIGYQAIGAAQPLGGAMATTTGTISTPTGSVTLTYTNEPFGQVEISGTYAGLIATFEFSPDNVNFFEIPGNTPGLPSLTGAYTFGTNETRFFSFSGLQNGLYFRVRATALTSGTVNVAINTSDSP